MSDHSFTSTRLMAQSAGQKASDAYSVARDALNKIEALRAAAMAALDEPDFDAIFDGFDRRINQVEATIEMLREGLAAEVTGILARLSALENQRIAPIARRPRGRPRKVPA